MKPEGGGAVHRLQLVSDRALTRIPVTATPPQRLPPQAEKSCYVLQTPTVTAATAVATQPRNAPCSGGFSQSEE